MRTAWILAGIAILSAACTDPTPPLAPTAIASPTPPVPTPPLPTTVPGVLAIAMPADAADLVNTVFGLTPFGYHGADHAEDGHPGWDVELRPGGVVRAVADGTVQGVTADPSVPGRLTVQLEHLVGEHHYRTTYTNLVNVSDGIAAAGIVSAGQPLGTAGTAGASAMTHFQLDDFEYYREVPNPNAVSPEPFLNASGKQLFDRTWLTAVYAHELVEPFITNPRESVPVARTWTRAGGDGPAGIRFTRRNARGDAYDYALLAESGSVTQAGTVILSTTSRPFPSIDLVSPTASPRLGVYDIVSNELRLVLAMPGSPRPSSLADATIYRTAR